MGKYPSNGDNQKKRKAERKYSMKKQTKPQWSLGISVGAELHVPGTAFPELNRKIETRIRIN